MESPAATDKDLLQAVPSPPWKAPPTESFMSPWNPIIATMPPAGWGATSDAIGKVVLIGKLPHRVRRDCAAVLAYLHAGLHSTVQRHGNGTSFMADSDPSDLTAVARLVVTAVARHDLDALRPLYHDNLVEDVPMVGRLDGADCVLGYFAEMYRAMPDFSLTAEQFAASGATVFVRWRMTGTFNGASWNGIDSTGASIDLRGMDCMTFVNGRLQHNFVAYDSYMFASQAGLI